MPTDPRRLAVLLAVHRAGGVNAAADLLHVTPSAVSQQITRLEAEEGVQVLVRGPRGATLTRAGRIFAESAERIEAELVDAHKAIATLGGEVAGRVTIAAFQTAIRAVVGPALAVVAGRYPGLELAVEEREPAESLRRLRDGDADIVLMERDEDSDATVPRGVRDTVLLEEPWRLVLPASVAAPTQLADLRDATWVGSEPGTAAARALGRVATTLGTRVRTRHQYYDFDVALALVAAGQGVAMLPALALQGDVPAGVSIVTVPGLGSRRLVARHRATRREPGPAVAAVLDVLLHVAAELELA
jgi:DNA-binding transcriptional LysR family regulator